MPVRMQMYATRTDHLERELELKTELVKLSLAHRRQQGFKFVRKPTERVHERALTQFLRGESRIQQPLPFHVVSEPIPVPCAQTTSAPEYFVLRHVHAQSRRRIPNTSVLPQPLLLLAFVPRVVHSVEGKTTKLCLQSIARPSPTFRIAETTPLFPNDILNLHIIPRGFGLSRLCDDEPKSSLDARE